LLESLVPTAVWIEVVGTFAIVFDYLAKACCRRRAGRRLFAMWRRPFAMRRRPFAMRRRPFAMRRRPFAMRRRPFAMRRRLFAMRRRPSMVIPVSSWCFSRLHRDRHGQCLARHRVNFVHPVHRSVCACGTRPLARLQWLHLPGSFCLLCHVVIHCRFRRCPSCKTTAHMRPLRIRRQCTTPMCGASSPCCACPPSICSPQVFCVDAADRPR
jgi:hypothetical protein